MPALLALINSAYRGEVSMLGWTTEAHLIAGEQRTDLTSLTAVFELPGSYFRVAEDEYGILVACVNLQQRGEDLYLGMLSVKPDLQNRGLGKRMLQEAEALAMEFGCPRIIMTVISVRTELIDWYKRHGYADQGGRDMPPPRGREVHVLQDPRDGGEAHDLLPFAPQKPYIACQHERQEQQRPKHERI
jgi:ribosomal protein S18 acetylase RimI-like enzyme